MKLKQQARQSQHLALTPHIQQSIRLLQLSAQELNQELTSLLELNPLLERLDDPLQNSARLLPDGSLNPALHQGIHQADNVDETSSQAESSTVADIDLTRQGEAYHYSSGIFSDDEKTQPQIEAAALSLREYLSAEIHLSVSDVRKRILCELIIDALDENGYMLETLSEMLGWLPTELSITETELEAALAHVQSLEPAGIAARNVPECLSIQLERMPGLPYVTRKRALQIVREALELFAKKDFTKLKKKLGCDDEDLIEAQAAIRRCNPHPAAHFHRETADTVVPEIIVVHQNDRWEVSLNPAAMPKLQINLEYARILRETADQATLSVKLKEAGWLLKNIQQRFETILRTANAIVSRQSAFFTDGPVAMRPLVLREIADTLELHESTISRVTNQKYMLTPHGIFELKYFFGSHVATESGKDASSTAIRERIRQLIGEENKKKPLSDNKIAQLLEEAGFIIARRTVAKYREALKILPAHMRKSL